MGKALVKLSILSLILWSGLALTSCAPTDADKLSDAQSCLNTATSSNVDTCVAMVSGMQSSSASLIRCSAAFIKEGYGDGTKIQQALTSLDNGNTGSSGSISLIAQLAFSAETLIADNLSDAQTAQSDCVASGSPGLIFLSGIALTATQAAEVVGADPTTLDPTQVTAALTDIASGTNPAAASTVGSAALSIYDNSCTGGNTSAGNFCAQFESVVQNAPSQDPTDIGQFLAQCYVTPSTTGCSGF